jgi:hypothetical protein
MAGHYGLDKLLEEVMRLKKQPEKKGGRSRLYLPWSTARWQDIDLE